MQQKNELVQGCWHLNKMADMQFMKIKLYNGLRYEKVKTVNYGIKCISILKK